MSNAQKQPPGLRCPKCGGKLRVIRTSPQQDYVTRRLECVTCGERVTSVERLIGNGSPSLPAIYDGQFALSIGQLAESVKLLSEMAGLETNVPNNRK